MIRHLALGTGFTALALPVLHLYLRVAAPGAPALPLPLPPASPGMTLAAVASFLLGWVTIAALSFPHSPGAAGAATSSADGGMPIIRRQVRLRWAESANPAA